MRVVIAAIMMCVGWAGLAGVLMGQGPGQTRIVRIGMLLDGPWEENERIRTLFESEIADLLGGEFDVRFASDKRRTAEWSLLSVRNAVDDLLQDPDVDMVVALGPISSHVVAGRGGLPKPVIATFVVDAELQGLPADSGVSGVRNLSYVAIPSAVSRDLVAFREIVDFRRLAFFINPGLLDAIPGLTAGVRQASQQLGLALEIVPVERDVSEVLRDLPSGVDAVYLTPLTHLTREEWDRLVARLVERGLPSFSYLGAIEVERGVLASLTPDTFFPRLARRVALNVQRILLGESPASIPVAFNRDERLTINMATARAIGVFPSWTVLTEAVLLNEEPVEGARRLSLAEAAREAVLRNLDLSAEDRFVAAGAYDVRLARAQLLPQLEVSSQSTIIDEDRAAASLGTQAQRTFSGGGSARQLIFSEPAWANVGIQRRLQEGREHGRAQVELDVVLEAATGYLNVLRATTVEEIRRDNLRVTRSNLELARVRRAVGTAGPGEVFRWESELARARRDVIDAEAQHQIAQVALNRSLNRPLEQVLSLMDVGLDDPILVTSDERIIRATDNPFTFALFRDFMVQEGLAAAPEIRQLESAISAQQRIRSSATNSFWSPTIAVQAEVDNILAEGGAGSAPFQFPGTQPGDFPPLPQANDLNWSLGIRFSLPLFRGGSRIAERAQASAELERLQTERTSVTERVEQRVRTALHQTGSSFPAIRLTREAADAAHRNLDVVTDAYSRGVATILDLLDAQNAALVADLAAANAVYDFLIDLMAVERAIGRFDFFMTAEERAAFFQRLERYFADAGIALWGR